MENIDTNDKKKTLTEKKRWPRLMSVKLAAEYVSLSPRTLYNRNTKNSENPFPIKPKKFGKRVLFDIKDLDRWADSL